MSWKKSPQKYRHMTWTASGMLQFREGSYQLKNPSRHIDHHFRSQFDFASSTGSTRELKCGLISAIARNEMKSKHMEAIKLYKYFLTQNLT
jgi:hypothetical protein